MKERFTQSYLDLPMKFYTKIKPTAVGDPQLVALNLALAEELGLDIDALQTDQGIAVLAGNQVPHGAEPIAQAYAGHQFGHFTMLGDGRAILLGELVDVKEQTWDVQLKGAGETPYSRGGDGRAALGPMLREYLISEAMHALGIPTTRSLAVVTTGEAVIREEPLPGAILTRVASSHLRVGTFEFAAAFTSIDDLRALANYAIRRHDQDVLEDDQPYHRLLERVVDRQAKLIATWQLVGFVHGVMNTDNMTISGETIDYGPCAFIDTFDRDAVFSSIDMHGRYAYKNQPVIGAWNLTRFAETLLPLLHEKEAESIEIAKDILSSYERKFTEYFETGMRAKLGLFTEQAEDRKLIKELLDLMEKYKADYTNTFIDLTFDRVRESELGKQTDFVAWYEQWKDRQKQEGKSDEAVQKWMKQHNPAVIPRNYYVEEALEQAVEDNDFTKFDQLLDVLEDPYSHRPEQIAYAKVPETNEPYVTYCGT